MKNLIIVIALIFSIISGCTKSTSTGTSGNSQTWCLWIGADKDTYVWLEYPDSQWGKQGYLAVAYLGDHKRSFVHFVLPNLPDGTEILEAYMELYHGGQNEDGYSDDLDILVQRASGSWSPETLTWNNQPPFSRATEFTIHLRSRAWCGSEEIKHIVTQMFEDPENDYGFIIDFFSASITVGIEKGFHANNFDRTASDMKNAPRLLVKVELPSGKTINDITMPPLASDNDLGFPPGTEILMLRYNNGAEWPENWNVVAAE